MPRLAVEGYDDIALTDGNDVADIVGDCYRRDGAAETIIVTRSNKRAREFNLGIRQRIMDYDEMLVKGNGCSWPRTITCGHPKSKGSTS